MWPRVRCRMTDRDIRGKNYKKDIVFGVLAALFITFLLLATILYQTEPVERIERTEIMMGTFVTITVFATLEEGEDAMDAAFERIAEVSDAASTYDEEAEAYRLNQRGYLEDPSRYLREIIEISKEYWAITNGTFDITIAPVLDLWKFRPWPEAHRLFTMGEVPDRVLNGTALSDEVRDIFSRRGYPVSENATAARSDFGWYLEESEFSLPEEYARYISGGEVDEDLKDQFETNGVDLSSEAEIAKTGEGRWNLTDGRKEFRIVEREGYLTVAVKKFGLIDNPDKVSGPDVTTQFWDLDKERQRENISRKKELVGSDMIHLDEEGIRFEKEGMEITLGGVAKGYAVDEAVKVLEEKGIERGMINAGGDIRVIGEKPGREKWRVALENPEDPGQFITKFSISNRAITTSGNYIRYFDPKAEVGHIIDPRTGFSAGDCMSVTIITDNCVTADILATAVFVMGPREGLETVNGLDGVEGLIIEPERNIRRSDGLDVYETALFDTGV